MRVADELTHQAEVETRNRKHLHEPLVDLPEATWEARVRGKHRLLYRVVSGPASGEGNQQTVEILRAIIKRRETTSEVLWRKP